MPSKPSLIHDGKPTMLNAGDRAFLTRGAIHFVRRLIVIGEFPFSGSSEEFRAYMEWLASEEDLTCTPCGPLRSDIVGVMFKHIPEDALSHTG